MISKTGSLRSSPAQAEWHCAAAYVYCPCLLILTNSPTKVPTCNAVSTPHTHTHTHTHIRRHCGTVSSSCRFGRTDNSWNIGDFLSRNGENPASPHAENLVGPGGALGPTGWQTSVQIPVACFSGHAAEKLPQSHFVVEKLSSLGSTGVHGTPSARRLHILSASHDNSHQARLHPPPGLSPCSHFDKLAILWYVLTTRHFSPVRTHKD